MGAVRCEADANWVLRLPVRTVQLRWVHLASLDCMPQTFSSSTPSPLLEPHGGRVRAGRKGL